MLDISDSSICIDPMRDWQFFDSMNEVPYVSMPLCDTATLEKAADDIRVKLGKLPMWPQKEGDPYDQSGWYVFSIQLSDRYPATKVADYIDFYVESPEADDDWASYEIKITEDEQKEIFRILDEQLKLKYNTYCLKLLEESWEE